VESALDKTGFLSYVGSGLKPPALFPAIGWPGRFSDAKKPAIGAKNKKSLKKIPPVRTEGNRHLLIKTKV
jgi:hypothetical protein